MSVLGLLYSYAAWLLVAAVVTVLWLYTYAYFVTHAALRSVPAPFPAQLTDWWLLSVSRRGQRSLVVDALHAKLGPVVRLQPNHVSINDEDAIPAIYGHGNGFLKSDFYDAFVSIQRGLFNTRDRAQHSRKRKIVAHTFSAQSVGAFEPYIRANLALFVQQWDRLVDAGAGAATLDCLPWFNYLAFDVIGDLAFGAPFGMLASGADMAEVRADGAGPPTYAPAIEILNRRGEVSATLGCLPALKPWASWLPDPFFRQGLRSVQQLAGIAVACVGGRLDREAEAAAAATSAGHKAESSPADRRHDLLAHLMEGRDEQGRPLGRAELTAEALTQLIAGSDTTSNSSCALLFYAATAGGGRVLRRLQAELDEHLPAGVAVPTYAQVRGLPYLQAVLNETLRHHSTSGIGLPREVVADKRQAAAGVVLAGYHFPPGTVLSVPTYSVHHATAIWGADAHKFRPERWEMLTARQRAAFVPFSHGPRACVGRNVAEMEMKLIVATWARRYDVRVLQERLETREGFLRKPLGLEVELRRR